MRLFPMGCVCVDGIMTGDLGGWGGGGAVAGAEVSPGAAMPNKSNTPLNG